LNERFGDFKQKYERAIYEFNLAMNKKTEEIEILNINYDKMVNQFENNLGRVLNY
jgi:hypothetical protein